MEHYRVPSQLQRGTEVIWTGMPIPVSHPKLLLRLEITKRFTF